MRFAAASASGSSATASGSASVSGNAGEFWDLGNGMRLRAWYICRGGGDSCRCNTFTLADGWGVNWSTQSTDKCCIFECDTRYKTPMGMIGQLQVNNIDYFVRLDCHDWYENRFSSKLQNAVEGSTVSVQTAQDAAGQLRSRTFDSLFRMAMKKDVKAGVKNELTFILQNDKLFDEMPQWSWWLLCGVIKHTKRA